MLNYHNALKKILSILPESQRDQDEKKHQGYQKRTINEMMKKVTEFSTSINYFILERNVNFEEDSFKNLDSQKKKITADLGQYNLKPEVQAQILKISTSEIIQWKTIFQSTKTLMNNINTEHKLYPTLSEYFKSLTDGSFIIQENDISKFDSAKLFFLKNLVKQLKFTEQYKTSETWVNFENFISKTFNETLPKQAIKQIGQGKNLIEIPLDIWLEDFLDLIGIIDIVAATLILTRVVVPGVIIYAILRVIMGVGMARNILNSIRGSVNLLKNIDNPRKLSASLGYTILNILNVIIKGKLVFSKNTLGTAANVAGVASQRVEKHTIESSLKVASQ